MPLVLFINLITRSALDHPNDGRDFFSLLSRLLPALSPVKCGDTEPLRGVFDLDRSEQLWTSPFFWASDVGGGSVSFALNPAARGTIAIQCAPAAVSVTALLEFLKEVCGRFGVEFGLAHILNDRDLDVGLDNFTVSGELTPSDLSLFVTIHDLRKWIPDLYWATLFGLSYVELFSAARIASAPAHRFHDLGECGVLLQVSEAPTDALDQAELFDATRERVKQHLGADAFFDVARLDELHRVPVWR